MPVTHVSLTDRFRELVARNELDKFVDNIQPTDYGCRYDWDSKLTCHIVVTYTDRYFDVQDVPEMRIMDTILSDFQDYESVDELVDNMVRTIWEGHELELVYRTAGIGGAWMRVRDVEDYDFERLRKLKAELEECYRPGTEYRFQVKEKEDVR